MPVTYVPTTSNQSLTSTTATPDSELTLALAPNGVYDITVTLKWSQVNPTDGGIQFGLSCSDASSDLSWTNVLSGEAFGNNDTDIITGQTGDRILILSGHVTAPAAGATLTVIRGLAVASANPTTLQINSILEIEPLNLAGGISPPSLIVLSTYIARVRRLLQYPGSSSTFLYTDVDITDWINQARGQLAGEAECIRTLGTTVAVVGQRPYTFANDINLGTSSITGIAAPIHVRRLLYGVGSGQQWIPSRTWEWFDLYCLNNIVPANGAPKRWAQYAQGAFGSFYLDPPPDAQYTLSSDCVCYPINLVDDTTVEAIPFLWTDAVAYFAAYLALLSAQTSQRTQEAQGMFERYSQFVSRARTFANPSVNRWQFEQATDPAQLSAYGLQTKAKTDAA